MTNLKEILNALEEIFKENRFLGESGRLLGRINDSLDYICDCEVVGKSTRLILEHGDFILKVSDDTYPDDQNEREWELWKSTQHRLLIPILEFESSEHFSIIREPIVDYITDEEFEEHCLILVEEVFFVIKESRKGLLNRFESEVDVPDHWGKLNGEYVCIDYGY